MANKPGSRADDGCGALATLVPRDQPSDVLVIKPSSLGDIVHTLPAVAWLKQNWPLARVHWVANTEWTPLLQGSPLLESVIPFPRQQFRGLGGLARARRWFRDFAETMARQRPVAALDFQGLLRSAWLAKRSGAPCRLGLDDAREGARFFYHHRAAVRGCRHAVDRYLALVRLLQPSASAEDALRGDWLPAGRPLSSVPPEPFWLIHPFSRGQGKSLGWHDVLVLAEGLKNRPVVVVGRTADPAPPLPAHVLNLANQTSLEELVFVIRRAAGVISVDSGPMHLASALHRPLLSIHTWSDPRKVGPYDAGAWIWKGGRILRRDAVDDSLAALRNAPGTADLQNIADFAREHMPGPA